MDNSPPLASVVLSPKRRSKLRILMIIIFVIPLFAGCSVWWNKAPATLRATPFNPLPSDASGMIVLQSTSATWLLRNKQQPKQVLGGNFVSISPDGNFLLIDDRQIVDAHTGRYIGSIQTNTYIPGLRRSIWLSPQKAVLGSYEQVGLYTAALHSSLAQILTPDCQLDTYSPQSVDLQAHTLLCLTASGGLAVLSYQSTPAIVTPIMFHATVNTGTQYIASTIWTPGSHTITFSWSPSTGTTPPDHSEIVMVRQDGSAFMVLVPATTGQFCTLPIWSLDGQQLAYVKRVELDDNPQHVSFQIHLLTMANHQDHVVAAGIGPGPSVITWSPNGSYLAYDATLANGQPGNITLLQVKSGEQTLIAHHATLVGWAE